MNLTKQQEATCNEISKQVCELGHAYVKANNLLQIAAKTLYAPQDAIEPNDRHVAGIIVSCATLQVANMQLEIMRLASLLPQHQGEAEKVQ